MLKYNYCSFYVMFVLPKMIKLNLYLNLGANSSTAADHLAANSIISADQLAANSFMTASRLQPTASDLLGLGLSNNSASYPNEG